MATQLLLFLCPRLKHDAQEQQILLPWEVVMVAHLGVASPRPQVLPATWIAGWRAPSSQVEVAQAAAEAPVRAGEAWKSIDQLS